VVVNIHLSSMIKSFYIFVSFTMLKGFFGFIGVFEFNETEISFNFHFIFEGFVILFWFSNSNFGIIYGSILSISLNKLL